MGVYICVVCLTYIIRYVWSWRDQGWFDWVVIPEYLNVIGALLYLASAWLYPYEASGQGDDYYSKTIFAVSP